MASVFLGDLDDFIGPSQSCVNPIFSSSSESKEAKKGNPEKVGAAKITLQSDYSGFPIETEEVIRPDLIKKSATNSATVSLNDCLACSGCVTSAETVLITQQSAAEFLAVLKGQRTKKIVVSISPQAVASLAAHYNLTSLQTFKKLVTLFKDNLGVDHVFDTSSAADFSLIEAREEFLARYRGRKDVGWKAPPVSIAVSSTKSLCPGDSDGSDPMELTETDEHPYEALPMLASSCPGWVCYAEKTYPQAIPYISTTKSPQQMMGTLVKKVLANRAGLRPSDVYHVAVMPCYDKKLEASRKDFYDEVYDSRDVDLVLATNEIVGLMDEKHVDLPSLPEGSIPPEDLPLSSLSADGCALLGGVEANAGSGGYLEHIYRYAALKLFNVTVNGPILYTAGRNADFREAVLEVDGEVKLRFAIAYGFRNIQSILTKIKRRKCTYDFVEIMACPSGCLNGGGQIKVQNSQALKERVAKISELFHARVFRSPDQNPFVHTVYEDELKAAPFSREARKMFHTRYHAVPKLELSNPMGIRW